MRILHDIGKIFIPPSVLQKPGRLTDEEYAIMKTHTTIGYKICMDDLKLRPYAAGALYHHEGLDGSGYPNGVKGNDIPYEAQIIRVADEFEAITAKRQYKSHVGIIETLNILIDDATPKEIKERMQNLGSSIKKGKDGDLETHHFQIQMRLQFLLIVQTKIWCWSICKAEKVWKN